MPAMTATDRRRWTSSKYGVVSLGMSLAVALAGCGEPAGEASQIHTNLGWLGSKYGMYVGQHRGKTPKTLDDLRTFVEKTTGTDELARLQVTDVGQLFVSPRDGKPLRMVTYAKLPAPVGGEPPPVVLYEETGQSGERAVAFLGGGTQDVDEPTLQKMLPEASR